MQVQSRYAAFVIHLSISFVIFLVLAAIIRFLWYPGVLFATEGGWQGVKLIAGVDLVIGPLLTLLVYNINKPELKRDLAIIGFLQASCLVAGMAVVAHFRPIAVIYAGGTFFVATHERFELHNIDTSTIELFENDKPVWINVRLPEKPKERVAFMGEWTRRGGLDLAVSHYEVFESGLPLNVNEAVPLETVSKEGFEVGSDRLKNARNKVYRLQTRYGMYMVIVDTETGTILELLPENKNSR